MVEKRWDALIGKEIPYRDELWKLTGTAEIQQSGELIALRATQKNDIRQQNARLYFQVDPPTESLNPGNIDNHFDRFERDDDAQYLIVKNERKSYRYPLRRLEFE